MTNLIKVSISADSQQVAVFFEQRLTSLGTAAHTTVRPCITKLATITLLKAGTVLHW